MPFLSVPRQFYEQPKRAVELSPAWKKNAVLVSLLNDSNGLDVAKGNNLIPGVAPTLVGRRQGRTSSFNGSSQYLVSTRTIPASTAFTVFAWTRPSNTNSGYFRILETAYDSGFFLGSNVGTQYAFIVNNATLEGCVGGQQVVGQRDFVCGVFDGSNRFLYVNGIQVASGTATAPSSALSLYVSRTYSASNGFWAGDIDTVGVFSRAFSPAEVFALNQNPWQLFKAESRRVWVPAAAGGSAALTGQSASLTQGTLAPSTSVALTGQTLTSAQGSVAPSTTVALTGRQLAAGQGSVAPSTSVALSGQSLTSAQGAVKAATSIALTGQSLTSARGTLSVSGTAAAALTGQSLSSAQGTLTPLAASNVALTGQQVSSAQGTLAPGNSVALSGQYLTSGQGSVSAGTAVALSGQAATLAQGSLGITGDRSVQLTGIQSSLLLGSLTPSIGAISSLVERTAIFHQIVSRSTKFQRSKSVTIRLN